jgi:hypothetical protein
MNTLLIYTVVRSKRLHYIADYLFKILSGLSVEWTDNVAYFQRATVAKLNYSSTTFNFPCLSIVPHTLLQESSIHPQLIDLQYIDSTPFFFKTSETYTVRHDILAASFYLLSRYEEYLPFEADEHGRFSAHQSLAYRTGFLQRPIIQEWAAFAQQQLQQLFPHLHFQRSTYHFQASFDIDLAWAYRHRPLWRSVGASFRDIGAGNMEAVLKRWRSIWKLEDDPYYVFDELKKWHNYPPIYFFLLADYAVHDKNIPAAHPEMRNLIERVGVANQVGIHPSYQSNENEQQLAVEIERLGTILEEKVTKSRQHYLRLHLPITYHRLLQHGIQEDYTMGYADEVGFRASTAVSFRWYDLEVDAVTDLLIYPFQVMDVTLKTYLQQTPDQAKKTLKQLVDVTQQFGGIFIPLWHNSSFSSIGQWEEWKDVYLYLLEIAQHDTIN